ncbi:unnamed protein product [Peronospora belbahrii]|uniref:Uncharacterized protein n=1 Tax=Peronospora belbahrii TaxID=622444 RepID=A0AAU9KVM2_9STRA|nr:unnamed protein product [Peronospora belbahrii]CAH0520435.1 unnamed protein product [Peronospora belbahrii]
MGNTPPPADPFRPQLDDGRAKCLHRRRHYDRSRSRSSSCRYKQRRKRDETHARGSRYSRRNSSWSRSRSRSRSRPSSRSHRRRSSASVERKWTHSAFDDRSPSPPRELDPFYRPEPEAWVSRAGGVYLPRK